MGLGTLQQCLFGGDISMRTVETVRVRLAQCYRLLLTTRVTLQCKEFFVPGALLTNDRGPQLQLVPPVLPMAIEDDLVAIAVEAFHCTCLEYHLTNERV